MTSPRPPLLKRRQSVGKTSAMRDPFFFGYGSLVNRGTHSFAPAHPARVRGWRREWRHVATRAVAFLTVRPDPDCEIDGLIAPVPDADWHALDLREASYRREPAGAVVHGLGSSPDIAIYHAPPEMHEPASVTHPVLLSYLDVVVQGYLREFGEDGVARFFETTDGWDAPVRDDRGEPVYSRPQRLTAAERGLVDDWLARMGARVFTA